MTIQKPLFRILAAICCCSILSSFIPVKLASTQTAPGQETSFVSAVKKAIPAVVFIKVKVKSPKNSSTFYFNGKKFDADDDIADPFGDDIFQHFFGFPGRGKRDNKNSLQLGQ